MSPTSSLAQTVLHVASWIGWAGWLVLIVLVIAVVSCSAPNRSAQRIEEYKGWLARTGGDAEVQIPAEIEPLTSYLTELNEPGVVENRTREVYADNAVLDDTLVRLEGAQAIQDHFAKTVKAMDRYEVTIDDIVRSGPDWYIRWTMVFSSSTLAGGEPIHSVGITQARLDETGRVLIHQDFWDSAHAFFEQIPVVGAGIHAVRKQL